MATRLLFTDDREDGSRDELELFANDEDRITIRMQDPENDYSFCMLTLDKEDALILLKTLTEEIEKI